MQEMDNAVNQVKKEITTRFDFRGSKTEIELDRKEAKVNLLTEDDMKLRAIKDMLIAKVVRRSIDARTNPGAPAAVNVKWQLARWKAALA